MNLIKAKRKETFVNFARLQKKTGVNTAKNTVAAYSEIKKIYLYDQSAANERFLFMLLAVKYSLC